MSIGGKGFIMAYPWEDYKKYPIRVIEGKKQEDILELQDSGGYVLIGHTLKWCEELEQTCEIATSKAEEYYNLLVEHGIIKPEPTAEDMLQEQQAINQQLMQAIQGLSAKIDEMGVKQNGNNGYNNELSKPECKGKNHATDAVESSTTGKIILP